MSIDRAAWPFVAAASVPSVALLVSGHSIAALLLAVLPLGIALFFRDPDRTPPAGDHHVLSPADGTVLFAGTGRAAESPPGTWQQVTIFLSPLDVHINRVPVSGRVTR